MAWQYCECGAGLDPLPEDIIVGTIDCGCGRTSGIANQEDTRAELLKQMYRDIETLKKKIGIE